MSNTINLNLPLDNAAVLGATISYLQRLESLAKDVKTPLGTETPTLKNVGGLGEVDPEAGACSEKSIQEGIAGGEQAASTTTTTPGTVIDDEEDDNHDAKGVAFDVNMCGVSAKPFYGPGKKAGQWKRKKGVDEAAYDTWYAAELAGVSTAAAPSEAGTNEALAENTAAASAGFGANTAGGTAASAETPGPKIPTTGVELITWTAERTASKHMTPEMLTAAFGEIGVTQGQLFAPNSGAQVAQVYQLLVSWQVPA